MAVSHFSPRAFLVLVLTLLTTATLVNAVPKDQHEQCESWADSGECYKNANFMLTDCATSCDRAAAAVAAADKELDGIASFFDLSAVDIDGNTVNFDEFRGQVTILTNVASYCGYTKSHYEGLVELWSRVADTAIEILAFPCNQFGQQEPGTAAEINEFAADQGVHFRMMQKINVNGPDASKVYKYLKREAGPVTITWNFATYYVVGPDGGVQSFSGVEPMQLQDVALGLLEKEEL
jgi:glutathione peroxidase-family protein